MKLQNETAEDIRSKLDKNLLTTKVTATRYINQFLSYTKQLKDMDKAYTKSKTVSMFLENILNPDYQNTVELCQAHKYDIHECIMQIRAKERRLEREEAVQRRSKIVVRRNIHEEKSDMNNETTNHHDTNPQEVIEQHKTDLGYYSIPNEVWKTLSNSTKSRVKQFNSNLRKRRRSNDRDEKVESTISPRRTGHVGPTSVANTAKRQKTVTFEDKEENDTDVPQENGEDTQEISNRRGILRFNVKASQHNN